MTDEERAAREPHDPDLNRLAAHFEGRLGRSEAADLEAHLAGCRRCRETAGLMWRALEPARARAVSLPMAGWLALAASVAIATVVGIRIGKEEPAAVRPGGPTAAPAPAPPAPPEPAPIPRPAAPPPAPDVRRGASDRLVAGKRFRLVAGEWRDASYDPTLALPIVEAEGAADRRKLLEEHPALAPYLALGDRVLVVLDGTAYRVSP